VCNVPKRNLGQRRMEFLTAYAEAHGCSLYDALCRTVDEEKELFRGTKAREFIRLIESMTERCAGRPVSELLSEVLDKSGYETMLRTEGSQDRLDNLAELKQSVHLYEISCGEECTLEHYLTHVALFTNSDAEDAGDKVKLMTVHTAKGLEFPYVFLCGMNEGIFPSRKVKTIEGMEEERRLAFVALTRAEKALFLTEAEGRNFDGSPRYPSRFLLDIGPELLEYTRKPSDTLISQAASHIEAAERFLAASTGDNAFKAGDRIRHAIFGTGTIASIDLDKQAWIIQFDNMETTRMITFRAKLEREE